ncbi:MAG: ABC transporter permease [Bacteroidales bacterium]|nr:ABC transporter permease [Bacteroidales bacterium]
MFERFIAGRFLSHKRGSFSAPLVRIATYSIALGVLVMAMSVSILQGFQKAISDKVVGFGSHIVVKNYDVSNIYEETPITVDDDEVAALEKLPSVKKVQFFASKGGMVKTDDQIHGIVMKGTGQGYDLSFFEENLIRGRLFDMSDSVAKNEVIISQTIARKLGLDTASKMRTYFWQGEGYRARAFTVVGIYNTDLTEFDEHYVVGDIRHIQKLNGWSTSDVGGYEVLVDDFKHLDATAQAVGETVSYDKTVTTVVEENQTLFSWLELLNSNIVLIICVMAMVCIVSVVSALLIMIFEKTSMIGVLKTLGATNASVRRIFIIKSIRITGIGIAAGTALAVTLCAIQHFYRIVRLDSESYSVGYMPVDLNPWIFVAIAAGTIIACTAALLLPAAYISRVEPAKTIRFE